MYAAWYLGQFPHHNVILASHAEELAVRNSRVAKNFLEDPLWPFEGVSLAADSASAGRWNTKQGGGCYAVGVGGAVTGRGANVLIIDDALHDALSESERKAVFRWYREVVVPRLEPDGIIIVIGARFAPDDLIGQILESPDGPNWAGSVVDLAAIAGEDDPLGRQPGDALWPERFPLAELEMRRIAMGSRAFDAQFQQNPLPAGGDLCKLSWLENRYRRLPEDLMISASLDAAVKTGVGNDYSAIVVLGSINSAIYVIDVVRRKVEYPDLRRMVESVNAIHEPSRWYVEDASSGSPLIQTLRRETNLPIVSVPAKSSKVTRFEAVSGLLESGRLQLPEEAPWLDEFMRELLGFPNGRHDDQVDALVLGLTKIAEIPEVFAFYA